MTKLPHLQLKDVAAWAGNNRLPHQQAYYAMYSSVFGGIVTDPALMLVPLDDHMVHRGDGVFETLKCVDGALYNWKAHLDRLISSAAVVDLRLPCAPDALLDIVAQTLRAGGRRDGLLRLFLSRGPGGHGVTPYECPQPAVYVLAMELKPPFMTLHPDGARTMASRIPLKPSFFANIKTVNYLPNVLMKKEATDAGVDFVVSFDERGFMGEGATENFGMITGDGILRVPRPDRILPGTTMLRTLELAQPLIAAGTLRGIEKADIPRPDISGARELLIFGTTPDVTAVVEFEGHKIGGGAPGPVFQILSRLITADIRTNAALRTPIF